MTHTEVAELFTQANEAWMKADLANDGQPVAECHEAFITTMNLSADLRQGVPPKLQERLGALATALTVVQAIPNPWAELTEAIALTQEAMREAWRL